MLTVNTDAMFDGGFKFAVTQNIFDYTLIGVVSCEFVTEVISIVFTS